MAKNLTLRALTRPEQRVLAAKLKDLSLSARIYPRYRVIEEVRQGRAMTEAADREGRAVTRAGRGGVVEPRGAGAAVFQLVGAQACRVLPQQALAAAGHRRMGTAAVASRGLERATHPDLETLP